MKKARDFKKDPYTVCVNYSNEDGMGNTLQCAFLLEKAFKTFDWIKVLSIEESMTNKPDLMVNTLPRNGWKKGKKNVWWDLETAEFQATEYFDDADVIFYPNHKNIHVYDKWKEKSYFLPLATDPEIFHYYNEPIKYDIGFIGREDVLRGIRRNGLDILQKHCKEKGYFFLRTGGIPRGEKTMRLTSQCLMTIQIAGLRNIEQRLFETAAVAPLLADRQEENEKEIDIVLEPNKHYIAYTYKYPNNNYDVDGGNTVGDWSNLLSQVDYYMEHPEEREKIVANAMEHMFSHHTYINRCKEILKIAGGEECQNQLSR